MGRYDKLKIYANNTWNSIKNVKVHNGVQWVDLGNDDSDIGSYQSQGSYKKNMFLYQPNGTSLQRVRITNMKQVDTVNGSRHSVGFFNILPDNGGLYVPSKSSTSNATLHYWALKCFVYKTANVDQYIYRMETSGSGSGGSFLHIIWLADGRLKIEARRLGGQVFEGYTTNRYLADSGWVYIDMWANITRSGWAPLTIYWGSERTILYNIETYFVDGVTGYCLHGAGDTYVYLKETFKLWAAYRDRNGNTLDDYITFDLRTCTPGTDGSTYAGLQIYQETYTQVRWL